MSAWLKQDQDQCTVPYLAVLLLVHSLSAVFLKENHHKLVKNED